MHAGSNNTSHSNHNSDTNISDSANNNRHTSNNSDTAKS